MKSNRNAATEGLSGKYLQFVFRQRAEETVVSRIPRRKKQKSPAQIAINTMFGKAAAFAKSILQDASMRLAYSAKAKLGQSAFNVAVADYFKPPTIGELDTDGYNGQVGSTVIAEVTDDFKVVSVTCKINRPDGTLIEEGNASLLPDGLNWMYVSTVQNGSTRDTTITFTAKDVPGHSVSKSKTL